ncbi:isoprenylcysteine carboxyl methyltransferase [Desulfuromonas sp. DDH964]|uniref:methyltransferase family protein n=1 Tax=Desulfuromonas sp. DDH964 TaxID=1823759 RepID=UPI00078E5EDA|nr:isoprenylcysteine carboxylmethyltransferase family protein [Desulfuromonas sp. DDH964]AMV70679.1 isoprenylcysteine carboxyl methyltransferase [Desulfuromonas sp. DDH964]
MQENWGGWTLAVFMIVIVSWVFYRFAAPKSWREWSRAGLVQAFIIALYAEMYGFPLTLYLLARFFDLDVSASANLWSSLLGVGELGMVVAMIVGYAFVLVGLFLLAGGWRQLYRARRENRLATGGLYAIVRHPQYTGILLAVFGEGVMHWPTLFSVVLFPVIGLAYWSLARKEEKEMLRVHGEAYREYRRRVPMLLPCWGQWKRLLAGNWWER